MKWLFIGPTLLSGIGQVTNTYCQLMKGEYIQYGQIPAMSRYDAMFVFILPIESQLKSVDNYMKICDSHYFMTVCETKPVNPLYGYIVKYKPMFVPSAFAKDILEEQFPDMKCTILRHYVPPPITGPCKTLGPSDPYIFYTIGNILDPRKNIKGLLRAFAECNFPNARLMIKATCNKYVNINEKNVSIINGLLPPEQLEKIHNGCHCYINCSHSEGVGMGAVEAAMRNKPVIITDFGGLKEYVDTPYTIGCNMGKVGFNDFLFTPDLCWGHPKLADLVKCMKECYNKRLSYWDHSHTRYTTETARSDLKALQSQQT